MTSHTMPQQAHPDEAAKPDQPVAGSASPPLIVLGDPDAAVCVDGVCRLPGA